jgi:hypothetical protein
MRNPGHTHPAMECDPSAHGPEMNDADGHPTSHADHPYIAASHKFTKPAFHERSNESMKGQDVSQKGDKSFGSY